MIDIKKLSVSKNKKTIVTVAALAIESGERVAILGPNGSGKTTLLRVLACLEMSYQGQCDVVASPSERVYVHQTPYMFRGSVLFNVTYGLRALGQSRTKSDRLAIEWIEKLGLREISNHPVAHLSGGERRRVALARALALRPRLLLLDEPLADLDELGVSCVLRGLDELDHTTVLVASPMELPQQLTTRTYPMRMEKA